MSVYIKENGALTKVSDIEIKADSGAVGHVCTDAQIANTSQYLTAPTDLNAFDYDYLLISLTVSGTEYLTGINVANISSGVDFIVNSHRGYNVMKMQLTPTTVAATYFTGSFVNIYCTIYGFNV